MLGHRELTIDEYLAILKRRIWIILCLAAVAAGAVYLYSRTLPNQYKSHTLVLVQQPKVNQRFVTPVVDAQVNQRLETMREQILSPTQLRPVVQEFHLYEKELPRSSPGDRASLLKQAVSVTPVQPVSNSPWAGIPGFTVSVTLYDPHLAQQVCARITSMFIKDNATWQSQAAQDTTSFLSTQISDAKQALDAQDAKLTAFKLRYLGKLPDDAQTNMDILSTLNSQLEAATEALNRAQQNKVYLESQLTQQMAAWKATRSGNNALTLEEQLADMRSKLVALKTKYTDDYPDVITMKNNIAQLQKKLNAANVSDSKSASSSSADSHSPAYAVPPQIQQLQQDVHQYNQTIHDRTKQQAAIEKKISEYQARVQMSPVIEEQYTELTRNYQTALDFYRGLLTKKAQADMGANLQKSQQAEAFRVIDPASFSGTPSAPNRLFFAGGGLIGGLCLGLAIVLWLELRDKAIRSERDVEFYLQTSTLALIPWVDGQHNRSMRDLDASPGKVATPDRHSGFTAVGR